MFGFIERYDGKKVEAGGSPNALNQCVDLANQYIYEVLGLPKILGTNAKDFPKKVGGYLEYIENTPDGVPSPGDLVVWGNGKYGHIGIFVEGNEKSFRSFDQNYPLNTPAHIQGHYYHNVIGWLHPKGESMPDETELETLKVEFKKEQQRVIDCRKDRDGLEQRLEIMTNDCETSVKNLQDKLAQRSKECQRLKDLSGTEHLVLGIKKLLNQIQEKK